MKKDAKNDVKARKLNLSKETIRNLQPAELGRAAGGWSGGRACNYGSNGTQCDTDTTSYPSLPGTSC